MIGSRTWFFVLQAVLFGGLQTFALADRVRVPQDIGDLQAALDSCGVRDTVLVAQGLYTGNFILPAKTFTLMSEFGLSGDSLDWMNCRLNGNGMGSVLTTSHSPGDSVCISGFVIENGVGYWDGEVRAGGLTIRDSIHVSCEHLILQNNDMASGLSTGKALASSGYEISISVKNVVVRNDSLMQDTDELVSLTILRRLEIENLWINGQNSNGKALRLTGDPTVINGIHVFDFNSDYEFRVGIYSIGRLLMEDVFIEDNRSTESIRVYINSEQYKPSIRNFQYRNNQDHSPEIQPSVANLLFVGDSIAVDSLIVTGNFAQPLRPILQIAAPGDGAVQSAEIRNLIYESNQSGNGTWPGNPPHLQGQQVRLSNTNLSDSRFIGNVTQLAHDPDDPESSVGIHGALIQYSQSLETDSTIIENCLFQDNLLIDPDDYSSHARIANQGRVIYFEQHGGMGLRVSNCVFEGNLQPNHCPENGYSSLGSVFFLYEYNDGLTGSHFENLTFRNNDDGTLTAGYDSRGRMRNIRLYDNRRMGLFAAAHSWTLENILISGQEAQDVYADPAESWQNAIFTNGYVASEIRNCTIVDSQLPVLLHTSYGENPATQIRNVVVSDCEYDFLEKVQEDPEDQVWAEWEYSYLPELPQNAGPGIVVDEARPFEPEIEGGFVPALGSDLVDGGHPGLEYNDIEDPALPGEPLWPARGELRNDMGYTGGPGYFPLENWTTIEERESEEAILPQSLQLLPARPNPFNPTTRLRFILPRAGKAKLAVYNLRGQQVRTLVDARLPAGGHEVEFHAGELASGVYVVQLDVGREQAVRKVLLLK